VSLEAVIEDVAGLAPDGFELAGYSMGGRIALHVALAVPDRVKRLVLIGASPGLASPAEREAPRRGEKIPVYRGGYGMVYDPATDTWAPRADMPEAVTHAGVAADGTTVWVVGGLVGDYNGGTNLPTRDVWKYNAVADTWSAEPPLPSAGGAGGLDYRI